MVDRLSGPRGDHQSAGAETRSRALSHRACADTCGRLRAARDAVLRAGLRLRRTAAQHPGLCQGLDRAGVEAGVHDRQWPRELARLLRREIGTPASLRISRAFPAGSAPPASPRSHRSVALCTRTPALAGVDGGASARRLIPYVISPRGMLARVDPSRVAETGRTGRARAPPRGAALLRATSDAGEHARAPRPERVRRHAPERVDAPADEDLVAALVTGRPGRHVPLIVSSHFPDRASIPRAAFAGGVGAVNRRDWSSRGRRERIGRGATASGARRRALGRRGWRGRQVGPPGGRRRLGDVLGLGELWPERARSDGGRGSGRRHSHMPMGGGRDLRLRVLGASGCARACRCPRAPPRRARTGASDGPEGEGVGAGEVLLGFDRPRHGGAL